MIRKIMLAVALLLLCAGVNAKSRHEVTSPDKNLRMAVSCDKSGFGYSVTYKGSQVVDYSRLGFEFQDGSFTCNVSVKSSSRRVVDEEYELPVGKVDVARDYCNELRLNLLGPGGRRIDLVCRAYDDAVAFRYEFPEQEGWNGFVLKGETAQFRLSGDPEMLYMHFPSFANTHETTYRRRPLSQVEQNSVIDMPSTFARKDGIFLSITEAAVRRYAGMMLCRRDDILQGALSPRLDVPGVAVIVDEFPHKTPWRVIMVSDRIGALVESTVLTSLADPCEIEDISWIKPCSTTFTWWSGNVVPDTTFSPGNNFETNKYYIDFCARKGVDLHNIYGYAETPWYPDSNFNFGWSSDDADPSRAIPCLQMDRVAAYAASKGVGLHLWVHWRPLYKHMEEAFAQYEKWGVRGMMIDFMERDDQQMIQMQEDFLRCAAKYHLFIQFHGACKPSGLNRTFPNEFTREGTLNYEVCKWAYEVNADHDISIPFTRMLAGSADYHMGGFRAMNREDFHPRYINPRVMSTRSHMMGMYIVLENYLTMFCDTPEAYRGQPEFDFLTNLPGGWDGVKVVEAKFNENIAIARRSGSDWWVGGITDGNPHEFSFSLDFLHPDGLYQMELFCDDPSATPSDPNRTMKLERRVRAGETLNVHALRDGGFMAKFTRLDR